jgi:hypothetical protein
MVEDDVWKRAADRARQDLARADRRLLSTAHRPAAGLKPPDHVDRDEEGSSLHRTAAKD